MSLTEVVASRYWTAAGLTMLHYLWVGALLGVFAATVRAAVWRWDPTRRYATALACLGLHAVAPLVIAMWVLAPTGSNTTAHENALASGGTTTNATSPGAAAFHDSSPHLQFRSPRHGRMTVAWNSLTLTLGKILPWVWLAGTTSMLAIVFTGFAGSCRLCRETQSLRGTAVDAQCRRIAKALGLGGHVLLVVSDRVVVPVVVGIWRPTILLPLSVWTGFQPAQIEMILWHELAHVRRYDNLMNLLERIVQSVLFFQPAVWIACRWVRLERENCCDAIALRHAVSRHAYAETLASLAVTSLRMPLTVACSANHQLVARIRYILFPDRRPASFVLSVGPRLAALGVSLACIALLQAQYEGTRGNAGLRRCFGNASVCVLDLPDMISLGVKPYSRRMCHENASSKSLRQ